MRIMSYHITRCTWRTTFYVARGIIKIYNINTAITCALYNRRSRNDALYNEEVYDFHITKTSPLLHNVT